MPMEKWDKCAFAVDEDELEGRVCYGGLDLSSTTDITAFVLVFPPLDEEDKYIILPYFWIPEDNLNLRVNRDHVPYDVWERQGYLQTTEGKTELPESVLLAGVLLCGFTSVTHFVNADCDVKAWICFLPHLWVSPIIAYRF